MNVAVIQARMASTRLPGKVLRPIEGRPMIWHMWWRLSQSETLDQVVVATGDDSMNQPLVEFCEEMGIPSFVGPEDDVLGRVRGAAAAFDATSVIGVTGDCPLNDPRVVDRVVHEFGEHEVDLCTTSPSYTYPDGFGSEVLSFETLSEIESEAEDPMEREHLTLFLRRRPHRYRIRFLENPIYHPFTDLHLSVDEEHDFELVRRIFEDLLSRKRLFSLEDVLASLSEHEEWLEGHDTPLNEGYLQSFFAGRDREPEPEPLDLGCSRALLERARDRIPSCTQTFSKGPSQFVQGVTPAYVERGEGGVAYDVDGNPFIDTILGLGAISLGHCHPAVDEAVVAQVRKSPSHSLPHRLEVELAERLCETIPAAEMVRFGKNGSDVTAGAVRLARAVTGRDRILCCGYHGWHDWYIGTTSRDLGVPEATAELTTSFPYGDLERLEALLDEQGPSVAALIMEPVGTVLPERGYLEGVKRLAHRHGALLIFDEIVTGFRMAEGGAQAYFGVTPDLACFGKGMANGYPISALVGRRDLMEVLDRAFFSFTFGGEAVSLAAAIATIEVFAEESVVSHMWIRGRRIKDGFNHLARTHGLSEWVLCRGLPPRPVMVFRNRDGEEDLHFKSVFLQECARRGVLTNGAPKTCLMNTDRQIDDVLSVFADAFEVLEEAYRRDDPSALLLGPPVEPIFRKSDY